MEKPRSASDSGETPPYYTVFIDTSLDTHLAMIVSGSDTVFDLKKKIMDEHPLCFPDIGGINIQALKVKRKGYFYHLSDSMTVRSAFCGISKSWFLSVDASSLEEQSGKQDQEKPNSRDTVACLGIMHNLSADGINLLPADSARNLSDIHDSSLPQVQIDENAKQKAAADNDTDNNCKILPLETENSSDPQFQQKHDLSRKDYEDPLRHTERKEESSRNVTGDAPSNVSLEGSSKSGVKKRRKTKKRSEGEIHDHALEEDNATAHVSDKDASQQDNVIPDNSLINEDRGRVVAHIGSKDDIDESGGISSSDANMRPDSEKQMVNMVSDGTAISGDKVEYEKHSFEDAVFKDQCNTSLEEASSGPAVKRKRKVVRKGDNVSTEVPKGDHLLITSPSSGKRKRKKKSSKSVGQVEATITSFTDNDKEQSSLHTVGVNKNLEREHHAAVTLGHSIQGATVSDSTKENPFVPEQEVGENNKVTCSFEVDMNTTDAANTKSKNNSAVERARVSEDPHTIATEGNSPLSAEEASNLNKDMRVSRNENVILNDDQKFGGYQTARVAEQRELSQNNDSKEMPSNGTSDRNEINMNSKVVVSSDLFIPKENVERGKSSKKRKKSKKTHDPVASGTEHFGISSAEPHKPANKDHSSDNSRKEESVLSPVVRKEVSTTTVNISNLATDRETDNVIRNVLESLQDINTDPVNPENKDEKSRKKTKRKRDSSAKSLPDLQKNDDVNCKNRTPLVNDKMEGEVGALSKLTKRTQLVKTSTKHGVETNPEGNNEGKPLRDLNGNFPNNRAKVSCESNRTIVNDNFVPNQHQPDNVVSDEMLVDKVTIINGADDEVKAGKDKGKLDVHSSDPSPDLQSSLKFPEIQGNEAERSLSNSHGDNLKLQTKTKLRKNSGMEARDTRSSRSESLNPKLAEVTRGNAISTSEAHARSNKNKKTVAASSSSLESSKSFLSKRGKGHQSHVEIRKVCSNNDYGEVVNNSKPRKSLLAPSSTIFKDDTDGSSDGEDGVENSDNSTRTPSDNSLSSEYSDGDSAAQQNGSYSSKKEESARRNITKSRSNVKLDTILRSSSRYKAAKLTASQSQIQDTESQPVEFVPDSLGNL